MSKLEVRGWGWSHAVTLTRTVVVSGVSRTGLESGSTE
jgi:hypothetical protein